MREIGKVLVVGGSGFIGTHLTDILVAEGIKVRVLDFCENAFRASNPEVEYHWGECNHARIARNATSGCDTIIYLAHHSTPVSSSKHPLDALTKSITPFVKFLQYLDTSRVGMFMYISTGGAIYGNVLQGSASETALPEPLSPYGVSKLAMESYLRMFSHQSNLPYMIIRPSNVYGPLQYYAGDHGLIAVALFKFITGQPIYVWGNGQAIKDYLFVNDMVEGILSLMKNGKTGQIYNIGSEIGASVKDVLEKASQLTGGKGDVVFEENHSYDVKRVMLSCAKIKDDTGWQARIGLEEGMARTLAWIRTKVS